MEKKTKKHSTLFLGSCWQRNEKSAFSEDAEMRVAFVERLEAGLLIRYFQLGFGSCTTAQKFHII